MTRVVFACWPFEGHVFPQMSMALELRARGAEVAFYTDESRRELIESQGFELLPFQSVTRSWERVHGRDRGTGGRRQALRLMREARAWIIDSIPDQVEDLQDVIARWRPDVIGAEGSMWGPLLVLSELGPVPVGLVSPLIGGPTAEDLAASPAHGGSRRLPCAGEWTRSGPDTGSVRWAARSPGTSRGCRSISC
jgi:UDP:flavonoid glycosyltransferase YjiC (YdhE family)